MTVYERNMVISFFSEDDWNVETTYLEEMVIATLHENGISAINRWAYSPDDEHYGW